MANVTLNIHRKTPWRRMAGMTLVELMISMSIGLFLIAGAFTVYLQGRATFQVNETVARLQENARYVFSVIEPDIRMAQFWGLRTRPYAIQNRAGPDDPASPLSPSGDCGINWTVNLDRSVEASNNSYGFTCGAYGTAVAAADTLTIRRASTDTAIPGANTLQVQTTRGDNSALFMGAALPAGFSAASSETRELIVNGYYVSQNSSLDMPGNPVPSLRRKFLRNGGAGPTIVDEEVLPGVEDLQIEFGIDTDLEGTANRGTIDRYVNPDAAILDPADAGFDPNARILAVRIWLRLRSERPEFSMPIGPDLNYADQNVAAIDDGYYRQLFTKTIFIRNAR
jgi:type IV pilus assembly protein PilW